MNTKLQTFNGEIGTPEFQAAINELVGIAQRAGHVKVANKTGGTLAAGTLVAINGYDATLAAPTVAKADASTATPAVFVLSEAILNNAAGIGYAAGVVGGLNTSGASAVGAAAYLSESVAGGFQWSAPTTPGYIVQVVGRVTEKSETAGIITFYLGSASVISSETMVPADGSVNNDKLDTDVKVGSLATLTTDVITSVVEAINEVDGHADAAQGAAEAAQSTADGAAGVAAAAYVLPVDGIPSTDMTAAVQTALGKADTALQVGLINAIRIGKVTLNGVNPTPVVFQADTAATIAGTETEPFALDNGLTLVVDPDGDGDDTITFAAAAGTSTSDASPATDMSASPDTKLNIAYNGADPVEVEFDWATGDSGGPCNDGTKIAAEMQEKIRAALDGNPAITVAYSGGVYVITSPTLGTGSSIVVTPAADHNCTEELKLGVADGGVEAAGTGDAVNIGAATAEEVADAINNTPAAGWTAAAVEGKVVITSASDGKDSSLAVNAGSTADLILGITGSAYGAQGLGYASYMADTDYVVMLTPLAATGALADVAVGVTGKAVDGFDVECETAAATTDVDLIIVGVEA